MKKLLLVAYLSLFSMLAYSQDEVQKYQCVCSLSECVKKDTFNIAYTREEVIDGDTVTYWGLTYGKHYPINFDAFYGKNDTVYFMSQKYAYLFSPLFTISSGEPDMIRDSNFNHPVGSYNHKIKYDKLTQTTTVGFYGSGFNIYSITFTKKGHIVGYLYNDGLNSWNCAKLK